ncbi:hypothetical protein Rs2_36182 [Raphanus sativus]|nr:hypothetical protein Rs2_36182 [Raphanus sativus]
MDGDLPTLRLILLIVVREFVSNQFHQVGNVVSIVIRSPVIVYYSLETRFHQACFLFSCVCFFLLLKLVFAYCLLAPGLVTRGFLTKFVKRLKEINFLREDLIFSTHCEEGTGSGVDTYFGLCTYPGQELRRRIVFKVYPRDIYAFGLIAWTGNDVLNRKKERSHPHTSLYIFDMPWECRLRLLAESKGDRLNDTGLFPATHSSSGNRVRGTTMVVRASASMKLSTEKQVFDFLGFPWLEPHERNL